jgi:hypothetical protein
MTRDEWENYPVGIALLYKYNVAIGGSHVSEFTGSTAFAQAVEKKDEVLHRNPTIVAIIQANVIATNECVDAIMDDLNIENKFGDEEDGYAT